MFISKLFTITKIWKQFKNPSVDELIKKMWHIHTRELLSRLVKEGNPMICNTINAPGRHFAK
jgi:hypothetical protein